jgi:hypothetical protein
MRATNLEMKKIQFGFAASIEKRKMGAITIPVHAYINTKDSFNLEIIADISKNHKKFIIRRDE